MKRIIFSFLILITLSTFTKGSANTLTEAEFCNNILKAIDICALQRGIGYKHATALYNKSIIDILHKTQFCSIAGSIASAIGKLCYLAYIDLNRYLIHRNTVFESC